MQATTQLMGLDLGFPDVCLTPPLLLPITYPDIAFPMMAIPIAVTIMIMGAFAHNMMTTIPFTMGDFPGVGTGILSHTVVGQSRRLFLNSYTTFLFGTPANRLCSFGLQNFFNIIGFTLIPGNFIVSIWAP